MDILTEISESKLTRNKIYDRKEETVRTRPPLRPPSTFPVVIIFACVKFEEIDYVDDGVGTVYGNPLLSLLSRSPTNPENEEF